MTGKELYRIWAPTNKRWVEWVRPVPFIHMDHPSSFYEVIDEELPEIYYLKETTKDTAIFVDFDGARSIEEGIALAKRGFRPIPIFNGTNPNFGTKATTNNASIEPLLRWGGELLTQIPFEEDAPPAFLLDENRLHRYKATPSIFDNSWDIYPQDIPSPDYFLQHGITKLIVCGNQFHHDLEKVLYRHQKKLQILFTNGYEPPKEVRIKKRKEKEE